MSNDEAARTDWEVAVLNEWWDLRKYDEQYGHHLLRRIKEGFTDAGVLAGALDR